MVLLRAVLSLQVGDGRPAGYGFTGGEVVV